METKANYVAVGAFVVAFFVGLVIVTLWLAGAQYSQEFAHYQTYFSGSVTGLGNGTPVRYNGIDVGRVSRLRFDPENPKRVIVLMQVDPTLKLHEDSVASIASMGLTGGAYVEIEGGTKDSPILKPTPEQPYPIIRSAPSTLQQLAESAPRMIAKFNHIGDQLSQLLNAKNRQAFSDILANLKMTSDVLAGRSGDLDSAIKNLNASSHELTVTLAQLHTTLGHADKAVVNISNLAGNANDVFSGDTAAQLSELVSETRAAVTSLHNLSDTLQNQPTRLLFGDRRQGYTPP
jgi:phospholipid/cholesterol/gamma-HCH transport system substrate-binding protein